MGRFSVVIPVFNAEEYFEECLDSVLDQTFDDYEVVIVDDGSSDGSSGIADEYASIHADRIKCIHQENAGQLFARRAGYFAASGEYIVSLDADDLLVPRALEILDALLVLTGADMIMFDAYVGLLRKKKFLNYPFEDGETFEGEASKKALYELLAGTDILNNLCTKAFSAQLLDRQRDYGFAKEMRLGEDAIQAMALVSAARRIVVTAAPLYVYRMNESGVTHSFRQKYFLDLALHTEIIKEFCIQWKLTNGEMLAGKRFLRNYCALLRKMCREGELGKAALEGRSKEGYFRQVYESVGHSGMELRDRITLALVYRGSYELILAVFYIENHARKMYEMLNSALFQKGQ